LLMQASARASRAKNLGFVPLSCDLVDRPRPAKTRSAKSHEAELERP